MADPNQTPQRGDWQCPCSGCGKARKLALKQVQEILSDKDLMWGWHKAHEFIKQELGKK
jgi:hypothetical protein